MNYCERCKGKGEIETRANHLDKCHFCFGTGIKQIWGEIEGKQINITEPVISDRCTHWPTIVRYKVTA